jgi:hypothetical protein
VWRFDTSPSITTPLGSLPYLSGNASANWRFTRWLQQNDNGRIVPVALNRQILELQARVVGPRLSRVFQTPESGYAERLKHLIEPSFSIRRSTAFRLADRIIPNDGVDNIVGGTTQLDYGLTNRLLARRRLGGEAGVIREILTVNLSQSYYSNALAAAVDPQNSTGTLPSPFSPLRFNATTRPIEGALAEFQLQVDAQHRTITSMTTRGTLDRERVNLSAGWSRYFSPELPQSATSRTLSDSLDSNVRLRSRSNRFGGSYGMSYDIKNRTLVSQSIAAFYNSQCCGVNMEWQSSARPLGFVQSNRQFNIGFTLAGIGTFSNPFGSFGGR